MDIKASIEVMLRTHLAALKAGARANAIEQVSGPGIGKSESKRAYCAELAKAAGEPVGHVPFMLSTISSVDVRGFMMPVKAAAGGLNTVFSTPPWYPGKANMQVFLPDGTTVGKGDWDGELPRIGVIDLDEFGQAEDDVKKAAAELLLHGEVGTTQLPVGWRVVAASNRLSDRSGVLRPLMFLVNRRMELRIDASLPAWVEWANAQGPGLRPHYLTMSFAQKNPDLVFRDTVPEGADPFCTPRTLCLMDRDLMALRTQEDEAHDRLPISPVAREVAAGWVGAGTAAQFFTHIRYADELPDMVDIEREPRKAKLPENRDAQMVVAYMLAHSVTEENARSVLVYIERLHREMQVLAIRAVLAQGARTRDVVETRAYAEWLVRNKEFLIASRS